MIKAIEELKNTIKFYEASLKRHEEGLKEYPESSYYHDQVTHLNSFMLGLRYALIIFEKQEYSQEGK